MSIAKVQASVQHVVELKLFLALYVEEMANARIVVVMANVHLVEVLEKRIVRYAMGMANYGAMHAGDQAITGME